MAHTPGPWWYDKRTGSIGCPSGWLGRVQHTRKDDPPFGNLDDDGQLLAAAPGLLAALEAVEWTVVNCWGDFCPWCDNDVVEGHKPDCQRQAAIAQAKGEAKP